MAVSLDHVTLRTAALEPTRTFFETALELRVGERPDFGFPGYWLYADGRPLVHLIPGPGGGARRDGECIDHVGLRIDDYHAQRARLEALELAYTCQDLPERGERRLFVTTPTGVLLELIARA